eukprot:jgi/Picsp_1/2918/NSC_01143-R1_conserved unknown protein [Ectocarpus siliculosus]
MAFHLSSSGTPTLPVQRRDVRGGRVQPTRKKTEETLIWKILAVAIIIFLFACISAGFLGESKSEFARNSRAEDGKGSNTLGSTQQVSEEDTNTLIQSIEDVDIQLISRVCGISLSKDHLSSCKNKEHGEIAHRLHILGERHSGTNVATELILKNFRIKLPSRSKLLKESPWINVEQYRKEYGLNSHKHNTQRDTGYYPGLSIVSIRNPYDWVRSMMKECYHCSKQQMKAKNDPERFVSIPWTRGAHILPHEQFDNIFDLRKRKFCNQVSVAAKRSDCVVIVNSESTILGDQQKALVHRVKEMTGWAMVHKEPQEALGYFGRMGASLFDPATYIHKSIYLKSNYTNTDRRIIQAVRSSMDADFERAVGYKTDLGI